MNAERMNYPCPFESEETVEQLLDYTSGRLDPEKSAPLERHMNSCRKCEEFRAGHSELWEALDAWEAPPLSMDFNRRLWQRIADEKAAPWYTSAGLRNLAATMRLPSWKPALSLAAAVLAVGAGFLLDHPQFRSLSSSTGEVSKVTASEAEQVERTLDDIQLLRQFDMSVPESEATPRKM